MTVTYLERAAWGGGPVRAGRSAPHSQFVGIVAHHTVFILGDWDGDGIVRGDLDDIKRYMRRLQTMRPDLGNEVPYSFVVFEGARPGDCVVAEGRGIGRTGAHTEGLNSTRYGVALAGNSSERPVTEGVLAGYRWIGRHLSDPDGARDTIGHRDTKQTECPGTSLYAALPQIQPPFTEPQEDDDVALTADQERWIALIPEINHRTGDHTKKLAALDGNVDRLLGAVETLTTRVGELTAKVDALAPVEPPPG